MQIKNNKPKGSTTLFCFSAPVMIGTFLIEIALAVFAIWRYKLDKTTKLIIAILCCLAIFQFAEFFVCTAAGIDPVWASRIGYIAITLLPPLGLHLVYQIAKVKPPRTLIWPAYASAAVFVGFFLFFTHSIIGQACLGNYVIFQTAPGSDRAYGLYYYGWLVMAVLLAINLARKAKEDRTMQQALYWFICGYMLFLLPTTTVNFFHPETLAGVPSIMCGFAVSFAIILAVFVLPRVSEKRG